MRTLYRLLIAIPFLVASLPSRSEQPPATPMQVMRTRHITVQVKLNGKGPFRMVLDTGSPVTFISRSVARKLGLLTEKAAQMPAFMGMGGQATLKTIQVGGAVAKNLGILILDHPVIDLVSQVDGPIYGIVGFSFFARFKTTIDYSASRIGFTPSAYTPEDAMTAVMGKLFSAGNKPQVIAPSALWGMIVEQAGDGMQVTKVLEGGPAHTAGMKPGDRIATIDGRWTDTLIDCYIAASFVKPGQTAVVKVVRDGAPVELNLQPRNGI